MKTSHYYRALALVVLLITGLTFTTFYFINFYSIPVQSIDQKEPICEVFGYYLEPKNCGDKCYEKPCSFKCFDGYIDLIRRDGVGVITTKIKILSDYKNKTLIFQKLESKFPIGHLLKCGTTESLMTTPNLGRNTTSNQIKLNIFLVFLPFVLILLLFYYCFVQDRYASKYRRGNYSPKIYKRI